MRCSGLDARLLKRLEMAGVVLFDIRVLCVDAEKRHRMIELPAKCLYVWCKEVDSPERHDCCSQVHPVQHEIQSHHSRCFRAPLLSRKPLAAELHLAGHRSGLNR